MADDEFTVAEIIYLGARQLKGGKLGASYLPLASLPDLTAKDAERCASVYTGKGVMGRIVGGMYRGECQIVGNSVQRVRFNMLEFVRRIEDGRVPEWELSDAATISNQAAEAKARKLKADKAIMQEIAMLRRFYRMTPPSNRPAVELAVLKLLRADA